MAIVRAVPKTVSFKHNDRWYQATLNTAGQLSLTYQGEPIAQPTLVGLEHRMNDVDAQVQVKKDRKIALDKAGADPIPAMDLRLGPLSVRGVNAHSGKALVTLADGTKDQYPRTAVLRVLTEEEKKNLADLAQAKEDAEKAVPAVTRSGNLFGDEFPELEAHYDQARDLLTATVDGEEFTSTGGTRDLNRAIERHFTALRYPYAVDEGKVFATIDIDSSFPHEVFRTRQEAQAYLSARQAREKATRAYRAAMADYEFDFSVFW